jgi:hypothetical protein
VDLNFTGREACLHSQIIENLEFATEQGFLD